MRTCVFCSLASAFVGGLAVICLYEGLPAAPFGAQEVIRQPVSGPPAQPYQAARGPDVVERLPADELTPEERVNIAVYDRVNRGVVNINTKGVRGESFFFLEIPTEGMGSGSVLDKQGHILTNYHVVEGAREIEVSLFNGKSFAAQLIGQDASSDLAVVRIEAPPDMLHPVEIGDSTRLKVGQRAFAVGNPFGLERTLTTGVISSLNRSLPSRNHRDDAIHYSNRRRSQPRQLGRAAAGQPRTTHRHDDGHRQPHRPEYGSGFRDSRQHDRPQPASTDR